MSMYYFTASVFPIVLTDLRMIELGIKLKKHQVPGDVHQGTDLIHTLPMLFFIQELYWDSTPFRKLTLITLTTSRVLVTG